jgi:branched-subunit amino acid transport protein
VRACAAGTRLFVQPVQTQRFIPVLLQLLHQLPTLLHPLLGQLRALVFFALVLFQLVFNVKQAAAELAEDVLWGEGDV